MPYRVVFSREAEEQLAALYRYIAAAASPDIAARYTEAIITYCESLRAFPHRGTRRDDVRPGLRITNYRKRTVIAFDVGTELVSIIGIFYGGQDYETVLQDEPRTVKARNLAPVIGLLGTERPRAAHRGSSGSNATPSPLASSARYAFFAAGKRSWY